MSEEIEKTQLPENCSDSGQSPFPLLCAGCGADIDAPDQFFEYSAFASVPHAEHGLVTVGCLTCGRVNELALWLVGRMIFRKVGEGRDKPDEEHRAETLALLERYQSIVADLRGDAETLFDESEEWSLIEFPLIELNLQPGRLIAVPMVALAASRGLREAVARRPGLVPPVTLVLRRYRRHIRLWSFGQGFRKTRCRHHQ
jgi:hypothetical protein